MKRILGILAALALGVACCACSHPGADQPASSEQDSAQPADTGGEPAQEDAGEAEGSLLGDFSVQGIDGDEYTQDIFAGNKLTIVDIMATWCGPCVQGMPILEELSITMADEGIGVVAIVSDTWEDGQIDQSALSTAKEIQEVAGVTFPMLVPESEGMQAVLRTVQVFPTSVFVDSTGKAVGVVEGGTDLDGWKQRVAKALELAQSEG